MRRLALTQRAAAGAPLARDVAGRAGEVLARAGYVLSDRVINALQQHGVTTVYVEDAASAGITLTAITPGPVMALLQGLLDEFTVRLQKAAEPLLNQPTSKVLDALRMNTSAVNTIRVSAVLSELRAGAATLARSCAQAPGDSGYLTDRASDDDIVGHSIHVAALTARIGAAVGFADDDLASATYAALLHDIGLIFVPAEIRASPECWSVPQRLRFEDHTVLGEALLTAAVRGQTMPQAVAAEHHEAQDGSGFPRGRRGGNRVLRGAEKQRSADQIALVSEIVAVADRYERLVSPAPARAGFPPAEARYVLSSEAGTKLNAEVVARFLETFPALPLGTEVRVVGGEYDASHGIVARLSATAARPLVRVYADRSGHTHTPVDLDLTRMRDVNVLLDEGRAA
ncbi:MAG: HD domain-containing protein [Dehalococcoidia bacterium]|nr:MAG: HD domain-containing protein [Dehalococcoidia bacterium]